MHAQSVPILDFKKKFLFWAFKRKVLQRLRKVSKVQVNSMILRKKRTMKSSIKIYLTC